MSDDNSIAVALATGLIIGALATALIGAAIAIDVMQERAVEYGIGGYNQQTGEFKYYEGRKCK